MESEDSLLLDCPSCNIMITVKVSLCNGTEFPCPICGDIICFEIDPAAIDSVLDEARKKQERELKRSFRLAFGDV
ncbi:MAG: hypothetical protein A4E32_02185 [Methanomassiliicoccales archaeon PtaU1.Bin124]|nr:MAG: hypothetical protein A4E32_02185 [Methanomassiliicoccales archaeon PtaU1.Bin124]